MPATIVAKYTAVNIDGISVFLK